MEAVYRVTGKGLTFFVPKALALYAASEDSDASFEFDADNVETVQLAAAAGEVKAAADPAPEPEKVPDPEPEKDAEPEGEKTPDPPEGEKAPDPPTPEGNDPPEVATKDADEPARDVTFEVRSIDPAALRACLESDEGKAAILAALEPYSKINKPAAAPDPPEDGNGKGATLDDLKDTFAQMQASMVENFKREQEAFVQRTTGRMPD